MPPIAPPIRVIVAAAPDVSDGLRRACEHDVGVALVAETDDVATALLLIERHAPDVVLADLALLETDGSSDDLAVLLGRADVRVIAVARTPRESEVLAMLRLGARGDLLADDAPATIAAAIRAVHRGEARLSPSVTARLFGELRRASKARPGYVPPFG